MTLLAFAVAVGRGNTYVLIPYDQPNGKDPHAEVVMNDLTHNFAAAGVTVVAAKPADHVQAVANAASLCAEYHANGLLVAEGRYEQTRKATYAVLTTVVRYPAHVEFRLDEIGCDGTVNWSKTTTADRNTSGFSTANVN
ncbi:MAG TPA: hypothetical protein VK760_12025, partial [Candidatus Acidoferrales bacterium]|nr:hypothetical protein [Candidatus Acidoferrales bacterium]